MKNYYTKSWLRYSWCLNLPPFAFNLVTKWYEFRNPVIIVNGDKVIRFRDIL